MIQLRFFVLALLLSLNVFTADYFLTPYDINLHSLIIQNNLHDLEYYLQQNPDRVNEITTDSHGNTLLHVAVLHNNLTAVEVLLKYGANPCIVNNAFQKPAELISDKSLALYALLVDTENVFYSLCSFSDTIESTNLPTSPSAADEHQEIMHTHHEDTSAQIENTQENSAMHDDSVEEESSSSSPEDNDEQRPSLPHYGVQKKNCPNRWTISEHEKLLQLVEIQGKNWRSIALKLGGNRTSKQCRERFSNFNNSIAKSKLSGDEKKLSIDLHAEYGNQWVKIAKIINGNKTSGLRTADNIKNFINGLKRSKNQNE